MSEQSTEPQEPQGKDIDYGVQYRVVTTDEAQRQVDVCFHGPGQVGFLSAEFAKLVVQKLQEEDKSLGRGVQTYDIVPVIVSTAFGMIEPTFLIDDPGGPMTSDQAMQLEIDAAEQSDPKKREPPKSN